MGPEHGEITWLLLPILLLVVDLKSDTKCYRYKLKGCNRHPPPREIQAMAWKTHCGDGGGYKSKSGKKMETRGKGGQLPSPVWPFQIDLVSICCLDGRHGARWASGTPIWKQLGWETCCYFDSRPRVWCRMKRVQYRIGGKTGAYHPRSSLPGRKCRTKAALVSQTHCCG